MTRHGITVTAACDDVDRAVGNYRAECDCGWESRDCDTEALAKALYAEHIAFSIQGPHMVKDD